MPVLERTRIREPWYQGWGGGTGGGGGGGAPTDASYVTYNAESGLSNEKVFGATVFYPPDILANRPSAASTVVGAMYFATDAGGSATLGALYRSDGVSVWERIALDKEYTDTLYQPVGSYQTLNANLTAIAGLTTAADKLTYWTGSGTAALTDLSSFTRTLLDDTTATAWKDDLGLLTFTDGTKIDSIPGVGTLTVDVDLSEGKSGGDTLIGGTAASDNMLIGATSSASRDVTQGYVQIRDYLQMLTEDKTNTIAGTSVIGISFPSARTITLSASATSLGNNFTALQFASTISLTNTGYAFSAFTLLSAAGIVKNASSFTGNIIGGNTFIDGMTFQADTNATTVSAVTSFSAAPAFSRISGGTLALTTLKGFSSGATIDTGITATTRAAFSVLDVTNLGAGTLATNIGLDVPTLSAGTVNLGFRSAAPLVVTPLVKTISAVGDTIPITAPVVRLSQNTGSSKTLTSAPTIADGTDGQLLVIFNTSGTTPAGDVVLQDQGTLASSNLRLGAASRTIKGRTTIILMFSTSLGDWLEIDFNVAL